MEHTTSRDAPAGRPFGHRGVSPLDHDPNAHFTPVDTLVGQHDGATVVLTGTIGPWERKVTLQGRAWAKGKLILDSGEEVQYLAFPNTYAACGGQIAEGERRVLHVRVDRRAEPPIANVRAINYPENVTAASTVLTDQTLDRLAAEAESGYDPDQLVAQHPDGDYWEEHRG